MGTRSKSPIDRPETYKRHKNTNKLLVEAGFGSKFPVIIKFLVCLTHKRPRRYHG